MSTGQVQRPKRKKSSLPHPRPCKFHCFVWNNQRKPGKNKTWTQQMNPSVALKAIHTYGAHLKFSAGRGVGGNVLPWENSCWVAGTVLEEMPLLWSVDQKEWGEGQSRGCTILVQQVPIYSWGFMTKGICWKTTDWAAAGPSVKWSKWEFKRRMSKKHTCIDVGIDFWKSWISILGKQAIWFLKGLAVFWPCGCHRLNRNLWNTMIKITMKGLAWPFNSPKIHIDTFII